MHISTAQLKAICNAQTHPGHTLTASDQTAIVMLVQQHLHTQTQHAQ